MEKRDIIERFTDTEDEEFGAKCSTIAEDIKTGKYDILLLIEFLGEFLVNPSPSKRELGVAILNEVLNSLEDTLSGPQLSVIVEFYNSKLNEHHQVVPGALKGILSLLRYKHFPKDKIPLLLISLFENVSCQQQQRKDRYNIYKIFETMLENYTQEILQMGMNFVYGLISSIDGERDPTNLLYLFKWLKKCLLLIPLGHLSEEMFDIISCYFPVDFKAPPMESNITRDDLAAALSPCLYGCPDFGELCIALALEKLDSSLDIAKKDSLILLRDGCDNFPASVYIESATKIWWQLQQEVFSNPSEHVKVLSLETLTKVIAVLSNDTDKTREILKSICDTVKGNLLPEAKLFNPSVEVLLSCARASKLSCQITSNEVIPFLTNTYKIDTSILNKIKILDYAVKFCIIYHNFHSDTVEMVETVHILLLEAILHQDDKLKAAGFTGFSNIVKFLTLDVRKVIYTKLGEFIVQVTDSPLRKAILCCLKNMAIYYEDEFRELLLDKIVCKDSYAVDLFLSSLSVLCQVDSFKEFVVKTLMSHLENNTIVSVKHIRTVLVQNDPTVIQLFLESQIIGILIDIGFSHTSETEVELLLNISAMVKILIGSQNKDSQIYILNTFLEQIYGSIERSEWTVILFEGLVMRLVESIPIDFQVLDSALNLAISSNNELIRNTSVQVFANMLNKRPIDGSFKGYIDKLKETLHSYLVEQSTENIFTAICWITKVLLMKNYEESYIWVDQILELLDHNENIASGLKIILNDSYESLNVKSHCYKMLLYRQKFFIYVSNKLLDNYTVDKISYLKAIGYLIEYAPAQAIQLQFKKIYRLIFLCLEKCSEQEVLYVLLNTINSILKENNQILENNVEDLLTRVLKLTTFEKSMVVRIEALKCLINIATAFPVYKILPLKRLVIDNLAVCLDDKKRLVRKEATEARSLWFLIDAKD